MSGTIQRFERLAKEAAGMEHDVAFAKALHSVDPVTAESWDAIFSRFQGWTELYKAKTEVPIPEEVKKAGKCSIEYPSLYGGPFRLPLPAIMDWLRAGLRILS